jgi:ABC-type amino acid transport substrate-binding protein
MSNSNQTNQEATMTNNSSQDRITRVVAWVALAAALLTLALVLTRSPNRAPGAEQQTGSTMARVNKDGVIRVAVVPAPPITAIDPSTKAPNGYAIDVIEALARNSQLKVEYVPSDWATVAATLSSGKADVAIGPIFMTEGRARDFAFSDSLFAYAVVAVTPRNNPKVRTRDDLKAAGLRIAVGRGGFDSEFVRRQMPQASVSVFPPDDPNLPMLEILSGRADVALADFATAQKFIAEHPDLEMKFADDPVSLQYAAFMIRNDDWAWKDFLNVALRNLDLSGEMSAIDGKYAGQKTWYGRVSGRPPVIR